MRRNRANRQRRGSTPSKRRTASCSPLRSDRSRRFNNPMGTDGFEFIEYAAPDPAASASCSRQHGLSRRSPAPPQERDAVPPGRVNFIVNAEPESFAQRFARLHGPSICAIAFRVQDAQPPTSARWSSAPGASPVQAGPMELNIPAIKGIGDSLIYFVDRWRGKDGGQPAASATSRSTTSTSSPDTRRATPPPARARPRPHLHRPPDAQRAPRPHGNGPTSTSACSTSARSATSTSRAS
jgi:hypothetical protein